MLVTNGNENSMWHFSSSFMAISLYTFCFQGHSTEKSLLGRIMRTEPETKLTDMKKIILRYFVQINTFFSLSSSLMSYYMKCKNYLSRKSKSLHNWAFQCSGTAVEVIKLTEVQGFPWPKERGYSSCILWAWKFLCYVSNGAAAGSSPSPRSAPGFSCPMPPYKPHCCAADSAVVGPCADLGNHKAHSWCKCCESPKPNLTDSGISPCQSLRVQKGRFWPCFLALLQGTQHGAWNFELLWLAAWKF